MGFSMEKKTSGENWKTRGEKWKTRGEKWNTQGKKWKTRGEKWKTPGEKWIFTSTTLGVVYVGMFILVKTNRKQLIIQTKKPKSKCVTIHICTV